MLFDKLKSYSKGRMYPFHMPGHKRNFTDEINILPYSIDLTEIEGFDNLHNPKECIKEIECLAQEVYKAEKAFLLINGSSGGILAAIRAMTKFGDTVAVARNCHKSVYNAIELCGLKPIYILPKEDEEFSICSSITDSQIETVIKNNPEISLVIITSPTYEGVVSDVKNIAETVHKYNIQLLVDEAHGAHFPFSETFPDEAIKCGADVSIVSLHKTLPSLTQTALLLASSNKFSDKIGENLSVFETSSPSYIFMSSIEKCLTFCKKSNDKFNKYIKLLSDFSKFCLQLKKLKVICYGNDKKSEHNFYDFDISKIVVSTRNTSTNGNELASILRSRYNIEIEMAYSDYALFMTSVCDTEEGFELLKKALYEIDNTLTFSQNSRKAEQIISPEQAFVPFEKFKYSGYLSDFKKAENKISLEYIWAYPPGIPIIVPGEVINTGIISIIEELKSKGVEIYSTKGEMPTKITIVE